MLSASLLNPGGGRKGTESIWLQGTLAHKRHSSCSAGATNPVAEDRHSDKYDWGPKEGRLSPQPHF